MSNLDLPPLDLPGEITRTSDPLPGLRIRTAAAEADLTLQGAHLTHWQPAGADPVLWLSPQAHFQPGAAIRGGIPVCFPWFGPGRDATEANPVTLDPAHGWARITDWDLVSARVEEDGTAELVLELPGERGADQPHPEQFPADALLRYTLRIGAQLQLRLEVVAGEVLVDVEEALHTYLAVEDVEQVRVEGLDQASYLDKLTWESGVQEGALEVHGEVDRVYDTTRAVDVVGPARTLHVSTTGSASTIVWNPWATKAAAMADMGDQDYRGMLCVESGNVRQSAITVPPGHNHVMTVAITVD